VGLYIVFRFCITSGFCALFRVWVSLEAVSLLEAGGLLSLGPCTPSLLHQQNLAPEEWEALVTPGGGTPDAEKKWPAAAEGATGKEGMAPGKGIPDSKSLYAPQGRGPLKREGGGGKGLIGPLKRALNPLLGAQNLS
jgi:hypothetical protein